MLLLPFAFAALASPVFAEPSESTEEGKRMVALRFMQVTGVPTQGAQVAWALISQLVDRYPDVPEETWVELHGALTDELLELSLPIYLRNFSEQELEELIAFYESPLGRKLLERTPVILQESTSVFGGWGESKLAEMAEKLEAQGFEPRTSPDGAPQRKPGSQPKPGPPTSEL